MKYIVELKEGNGIIDLCYAVKDVGKVIPIKFTSIEEELNTLRKRALDYIEEEIKNMPLNGCKLRLIEIKEILGGGKNE